MDTAVVFSSKTTEDRIWAFGLAGRFVDKALLVCCTNTASDFKRDFNSHLKSHFNEGICKVILGYVT